MLFKHEIRTSLPCGRAFAHITHAALERLGAVAERADTTVPKSVVCTGLKVSFWPAGIKNTCHDISVVVTTVSVTHACPVLYDSHKSK